MKRIFGALRRSINRNNYLNKAVKQVEKVDDGKVKIPTPRHPSEKEYIENAQMNEEIKEDLEMKHETLIENMNKFSIRSIEPVERWTSSRPLPTWESEWLHRNDPVWEYGFYEPPEEKIPKGKLTFREALEVMRAKLELQGNPGFKRPQRPEAEKILQEHSAVHRVEKEKLDRMWQYFRPFERRDEQKVVRIADLAALQEAMHGYSDEASLTDGFRENLRKMLEQDSNAKESFEKLDEKEQQLFLEAVKEQRQWEHQRLTERLTEIESMNEKASRADNKKKEKRNHFSEGYVERRREGSNHSNSDASKR
uniref:39S ribosomal protein L59, mitochondrial n=1 Tax=Parascaris univalens TaxID=6257 RepID=A0A914ZKE5_PARUN